jgi:hypothetical protein
MKRMLDITVAAAGLLLLAPLFGDRFFSDRKESVRVFARSGFTNFAP